MKNVTMSVVLLGVLSVGFLAGSWYNQRERVSAAALHARKILYYVDPMHPAYKSDKPGIAPDCGMQLDPVYGDDAEGHADHGNAAPPSAASPDAVTIPPEKQQLIGVRLGVVEKVSHTPQLRLYGRVTPEETRVYRINAGMDGYIRELSGVTTGSQVRRDEWLAAYYAPEARSPIQGYLLSLDVLDRTTKAAEGPGPLAFARASVQQSIDRLLTFGVSRVQIEEIERTRQFPPNLKMTAPADGFVLIRNVSVGQKFDRGDELYTIADLRRVWILADVFGAEAEYVRPGMLARVALPGSMQTFRATVSRAVLPQFDAATQSLKVRLDADNPGYLLRPDMFVDVELPVALEPSIAVPVDAVLDSGLKKTVFVARGEGVFEPRDVETGWRFGDRVQIAKGLEAGERIVVSGTFLLDSESKLRHFRNGARP